MSKAPIYYVYGLFRPDTGEIFYVGMGSNKRAWCHERYRVRGRSYKDNVICKYLDDLGYNEIPIVFIREKLDRKEACLVEVALIAAIGRYPNGPLTNLTAGGEGAADLSPEAYYRRIKSLKEAAVKRWTPYREKKALGLIEPLISSQRGVKRSLEACRRMSEARRGKPSPTKGTKRSLEARENILQAAIRRKERMAREGLEWYWTGKKMPEGTGAKISTANKGKAAWNKGIECPAEVRAKISAKLTGQVIPEATKAKLKETTAASWTDPDVRRRRIAGISKPKSPEGRENMKRAQELRRQKERDARAALAQQSTNTVASL